MHRTYAWRTLQRSPRPLYEIRGIENEEGKGTGREKGGEKRKERERVGKETEN